ncbi:U-box domain-containing protein 4-like [Aristolochia californica]|uniref:U-box domain-containing protein 4-like n=1 Tax=Aristolochia californica TaxID=171875 RepID=UPI0035E23B2D
MSWPCGLSTSGRTRSFFSFFPLLFPSLLPSRSYRREAPGRTASVVFSFISLTIFSSGLFKTAPRHCRIKCSRRPPDMAKYRRNDVGSLVLDRPSGSHFPLWPGFSGAAFRRKLFDTMRCGVSRHPRKEARSPEQQRPVKIRGSKSGRGSERLSELLNLEAASDVGFVESEAEAKRKMLILDELRRVVKRLQFEEGEKKKDAARDVRCLAKENADARVTLAMLGAIPTLVGMLDAAGEDSDLQIQALYALLNLGIGNDMNKAAIVKAGAIHKMLKLIETPDKPPCLSEAIVANFLGLSALDENKPVIGSSGAISFLSDILQKGDGGFTKQAEQDSLRALFNLSIFLGNIPQILECNLVQFLLNSLGDMDISDRILSILSNIVSSPEGRKAVGSAQEAYPILIDVLNWTDSPGCQEKASYIMMVMSHKAWWDRRAMIDAGIASTLLELTLLGTTLAQKRASRILECLRLDKGKQVCGSGPAVSAPLYGGSSSIGMRSAGEKSELKVAEEELMMSEERRAVKQLVQQSLLNNMRRIVKRANLPQDFAPSDHFKSLTASSTSKSLPL